MSLLKRIKLAIIQDSPTRVYDVCEHCRKPDCSPKEAEQCTAYQHAKALDNAIPTR